MSNIEITIVMSLLFSFIFNIAFTTILYDRLYNEIYKRDLDIYEILEKIINIMQKKKKSREQAIN